MQTLELFDAKDIDVPIDERIAKATKVITRLFEQRSFTAVPFSGGKDSSTVCSLVLNAAREFVKKGGQVDILVTTSDTGIENPSIRELYIAELQKMRAYGQRHGFAVATHVVKPNLLATWQLKILSGRGLPSFAGTSTDCSRDLKIVPQRTFRKQLFAQLQRTGQTAVTVLGTRFDESEKRALRMALRGEREDVPVENKEGDLILSPIAFWSSMDVFEYLGNASSGLIEAYSDFKDTLRIYAHSAGTSCAVVAEAIYEGTGSKKGGCGARHGCFLCQQAEDKSLANMVDFSEEYEYARPLVRLNNYIRATRYDWSKRHWVGRTIQEGYIAIEPDTYHPAFIRELTRYMLQIDFDEMARARWAGEAPKFTILPEQTIIALDAMQSANGVALPFQIWADYRAIHSRHVRYDVPEIETVPVTPRPPARFLYVGNEWESCATGITGLRDVYIEALTEGSPCEPTVSPLKDGRHVWDVETEGSFSVNDESAMMILDFELDNLVDQFSRGLTPGGITYAYKWYLMYGALELSHSQRAKHDEILRRTAFKDRRGLTVNYDVNELYEKALPFSALPPAARKVWGEKATTESAQVEMDLSALFA